MRASLRALAVLVAFGIVTTALAMPARADADKPSWSVGDHWTYNVRGQNFGMSGSGTLRLEVVGPDTVNVAGTDYASWRVRVVQNVTQTNVDFNSGDVWHRQSDLAIVRVEYSLTVDLPFFGPTVVNTMITYNQPLPISWPVTAGKTWSGSTTVTTEITGLPDFNNPLTTLYIVQATATVTVPAGTFETTPVRADSGGSYSIAYWAPSSGSYARQQSFNSQSQETSSQELTEYRYQGSSFLGLPIVLWLLIILLVIIVLIGLVFRRRQQPRGVQLPPPPMAPPPGPPR